MQRLIIRASCSRGKGRDEGKMEKFLQHKDTSHLDRAVSPRWPWESYLNIAKLTWGCSELLQKAWEGKAGGTTPVTVPLWLLARQMLLQEGSQGWGFSASCSVRG